MKSRTRKDLGKGVEDRMAVEGHAVWLCVLDGKDGAR